MRTLFRLLTLLLCVELIVSPINPSLSLIAQNAMAQGSCPAGLKYDNVLNRCLSTDEATKVLNATAKCASGDVNCYKTNAQDLFQEQVNKGAAPERKGNNGFVSSVTNIAAIAGPVTYAVIGMSTTGAKCASPSFWGMVAGAAALVVGENLANFQHKKRLKKIKEDWGKIVNPEQANGDKDKERETSIEAQGEAFEMLARAEDSLAQAASMKRNFFLVATAAYGVTAAMAAMELYTNKTLKAAAVKTAIAAATTPAQLPQAVAAASAVKTAAGKAEASDAAEVAKAATAIAPVTSPEAIAKATADLTSIHGASTAMATAATTVAAAAVGPQASVLATAVTTSAAAGAAATSWATHTQTIVCIPIGGGVTKIHPAKPNSLYSYYEHGSSQDIRAELRSLHNLRKSENLTAFFMNKKELDGEVFSPLDEYVLYKEMFKSIEPEKEIFQVFKETSLMVLNNLNPLSIAHAEEDVNNLTGTEERDYNSETSQNASSTSPSSPGVNTNAANAYKEDKAKGIDLLSIGLGVGLGVLLAVKGNVGAKLITSKGRLIFSGVMTGLTLLMANHAGSQAEASTKRAALLRKMKSEFETAAGAIYACKSEDRNDPSKPNCYCYTPENGRNTNRSNSQVCQKLWAGINIKATNYGTAAQSTRVCINNQKKADPTCACKQTKSCMKVGVKGINGLNAGSMSMLSSALSPLNSISDGSADGATMNTAALENNAMAVKKFNDDLMKNPAFADINKGRKAAEDKLMKDLTKGSSSLGGSGLLGSNASSNLPSNPKEAASMLQKEIESQTATPINVDGNDLAMPSNVPSNEPEFGLSQDALAAQETQIAELMKEDLEYGGSDINAGSKQNIFEVLSNRYQRSGMRRLFDEGTPAPTAAPVTPPTETAQK